MSRKTNCWDNALVESFFASFKSELVEQLPIGKFENLTDAHRLIADYIDNFYNRTRLLSTLDYNSPVAFEMANRLEELSADLTGIKAGAGPVFDQHPPLRSAFPMRLASFVHGVQVRL